MPKPFPEEFRRDAFAVARKGEVPSTTIAKDFGVSPAALNRWFKNTDEEEDPKARPAKAESAKLREAKKPVRLLEQEAEVMRRAVAHHSRDVNPKIMYPLARRLAAGGIAVAVTCRALNVSKQGVLEMEGHPSLRPRLG